MAEMNLNTTYSPGLSPELKTFYDKTLLKEARPNLVHAQLGQKRNIPKNGGKTIEFRGYTALPKTLVPLAEGVTPNGSSLNVKTITATVEQYGDYVALSDMILTTAIDNNLVEANELLGAQSGETLDRLTAEVINSGTNVQFSGGKTARSTLKDGDILTVDDIKKAVRTLKRFNVKKIKGDYVGIIHPDVSYDLTSDPAWENVKTYSDPEDFYAGEIGRIHGVRFVETTEAMIFYGDIASDVSTLTVSKVDGSDIYVEETVTSSQATALASKTVIIKGKKLTVTSATAGSDGAAKLTMSAAVPSDIVAKTTIYGGSGAADGRPVYSTLIIGANAYGVIDLAGGGIQTITKQLGSAGTADPLDQRATTGWKAAHAAAILSQEAMVRIESVSSNDATPPTN